MKSMEHVDGKPVQDAKSQSSRRIDARMSQLNSTGAVVQSFKFSFNLK